MSIIGGARVEGQDYRLTARTISVTPSTGLREELLARHSARLSGQQVDMNAPAIRMFLDDGLVNRLVAIGEIPPLPGEPQPVDTEGLSPGRASGNARIRTNQPWASIRPTKTDQLASGSLNSGASSNSASVAPSTSRDRICAHTCCGVGR